MLKKRIENIFTLGTFKLFFAYFFAPFLFEAVEKRDVTTFVKNWWIYGRSCENWLLFDVISPHCETEGFCDIAGNSNIVKRLFRHLILFSSWVYWQDTFNKSCLTSISCVVSLYTLLLTLWQYRLWSFKYGDKK